MYMSKEYNWEVPLPFCPWFTQCSRRVGTQSLERHERETRGMGVNWKSGSVVECALIGSRCPPFPSLSVSLGSGRPALTKALGTAVLSGDMADDDDVAEDWEDADTEVR